MTTEQSEQDFRDIERVRDLPPDEPYGDREADYWDALDFDEGAEGENAAKELGEDA